MNRREQDPRSTRRGKPPIEDRQDAVADRIARGAPAPERPVGRARAGAGRTRVPLDTEMIVDAAMAIADREGPDAMTMRKIAGELGVGVMSLYWYVPTKRDLEALVLERLILDAAAPEEPTGDWRTDLASIAHAARNSMLRHPWMVNVITSASYISPEGLGHGLMRHIENSMRMTETLPFSLMEKMAIISAVDNYTQGATVNEVLERNRLEILGMTHDEMQQELAPRMQEMLAQSSYPLVENLIRNDGEEWSSLDARFESGLQLILDGVAHRLAARENSEAEG